MAGAKFKYNPKTLRYERLNASIVGIALRGFAYLVFGGLFFIALVLILNFIIETPLEKSLRSENEALAKHKVILMASLQESNYRIGELKKEDQELYEKLFETKITTKEEDHSDKEDILSAEPDLFSKWEEATRLLLGKITNKAAQGNSYYRESASINRSKLKILESMPKMAPVVDFNEDKLVSGFGKRINPFHKGLYFHDGVDISMTSGSSVIATASGTVILANQSNQISGFGNYIEIDHGNGFITRYAHLGELKTRYGQKVKKGQHIATVGSSGGSIAPHLHYEVIKNSKNVNPVYYMFEGLDSNQYQHLVINSNKENQSLD